MSDLPDEVVERVAKAICRSEFDCECATLSAMESACRGVPVREARAALAECRWLEMREALRHARACIGVLSLHIPSVDVSSDARAKEAIAEIDAALAKARGD